MGSHSAALIIWYAARAAFVPDFLIESFDLDST
jgi:hypothetical protein